MALINEAFLAETGAQWRKGLLVAGLIVGALLFFTVYLYDQRNSFWQATLLIAVTLIGIAFITVFTRAQQKRIGARGIPVHAVLVQANTKAFRKGFNVAPAQVFFSLDPAVDARTDFLIDLVRRARELRILRPSDPVARIVADETHVPNRRRRLPESFTGGAEVFAGDLTILERLLRERHLTEHEQVLLCLAEPGEKGGLVLVPWQVREAAERAVPAAARST